MGLKEFFEKLEQLNESSKLINKKYAARTYFACEYHIYKDYKTFIRDMDDYYLEVYYKKLLDAKLTSEEHYKELSKFVFENKEVYIVLDVFEEGDD